jgi:hypothetical protein
MIELLPIKKAIQRARSLCMPVTQSLVSVRLPSLRDTSFTLADLKTLLKNLLSLRKALVRLISLLINGEVDGNALEIQPVFFVVLPVDKWFV